MLIDDRYDLVKRLGSGFSGEVWLAHDQNQDQTVALKLFRPGQRTPAFVEAQVLTALSGPHVLRVHNAATDRIIDVPYIATEVAAEGSSEDRLSLSPLGIRPDV